MFSSITKCPKICPLLYLNEGPKVLFLSVALQSPIVYHNQQSGGGNSSSLTRNRSSSGNQTTTSSHSRPSSVVGLCNTEKGKSQVKVSTSNGGSSCFDSMVSMCRLYDYQLTFIFIFLLFNLRIFCFIFCYLNLEFCVCSFLPHLSTACRLHQALAKLGH